MAEHPSTAHTDRLARQGGQCELSRFATFAECPHCSGEMRAEHAHFRCASCGWRDSCCD